MIVLLRRFKISKYLIDFNKNLLLNHNKNFFNNLKDEKMIYNLENANRL